MALTWEPRRTVSEFEMKNIFFDPADLKYVGKNVIIGKTVRIRYPELVSISDNSIIDDFTYISTALDMGSFSHIGPGCSILGGKKAKLTISDFVNIAPSCQIVSGSNDYTGGGLVGPAIPKPYCGKAQIEEITLKNHCLLGAQTVVLPGVNMPEGMATGAFTLVKKAKYKNWTVYVGIPCKELCKRDGSDIIAQSEKLKKDYR